MMAIGVSDWQRVLLLIGVLTLSSVASAIAQRASDTGFERFLHQELWPQAEANGITRALFDSAFAGVSPDPEVLALTRSQPEYLKPIGRYLASRVADGVIASGRRQAANWSEVLARIERDLGVDRSVVLGIWGLESG